MIDALPFKDYQQGVLDTLQTYLDTLQASYGNAADYYAFLTQKGNRENAVHPGHSSYCADAWEKVKSKVPVPRYGGKDQPWQERRDGIGRQIPNICLKVPTGGGKTLLASCALQRINQDYFKRSNGLVLWIVPTESIYRQTKAALADKTHPYRKQLDLASGGCTKFLERGDAFDKQDVENNLCVMLLMLQSFNIDKRSKDARKIYRDSGKYMSFFPPVDDYNALNALMNEVPNLVESDMLERDVIQGISIEQSLGNVFRLCRPIVVLDEEHRAKSKKAIENVNAFNPRFIMELSATPRKDSNKLVDVGGFSLKEEQMIKLPINVMAGESYAWQNTLDQAHEKLEALQKDAATLQGQDGTYIRPMMVIIAEPKKKGEDYNQVEEIRRYLIDKCQVPERQIRVKLSNHDELKGEDLMSRFSPVRYIITKDALREGWDCPFAYILTILTPKQSETALTQYTGRVLRQPYATATPIAALNQSYIYCSERDVSDAVAKIKEGLENEGMGDIASDIQAKGGDGEKMRERVEATRNEHFQQKIFLPSLTALDEEGKPHTFDYYRDILAEIDWSDYHYPAEALHYADKTTVDSVTGILDYQTKDGQQELDLLNRRKTSNLYHGHINLSLLTSQLTDKIPNPFEARRVITQTIDTLKARGDSEEQIAAAGGDIVYRIKQHAFEWLLAESEKRFADKLEQGRINLQLLASSYQGLNWQMGDSRIIWRKPDEAKASWEKCLFQPQYRSNFNRLELDVAAYINKSEAVKWWHRLGVKGTEYALQGWKKDKIYPDFLIYREDECYYFIETKGNHLKNSDSEYKAKVFEYLTNHQPKVMGDFKVIDHKQELAFKLVYEDEWKEDLEKIHI